jgi:hypothetical protein
VTAFDPGDTRPFYGWRANLIQIVFLARTPRTSGQEVSGIWGMRNLPSTARRGERCHRACFLLRTSTSNCRRVLHSGRPAFLSRCPEDGLDGLPALSCFCPLETSFRTAVSSLNRENLTKDTDSPCVMVDPCMSNITVGTKTEGRRVPYSSQSC